MKDLRRIIASLKGHIAIDCSDDGMAVVLNCENVPLEVIFSWGMEWEHASVVVTERCPTWHEMCFVRDFFWNANECVVQYHPPDETYINVHNHCLHLWRSIKETVPMPPIVCV